MFMCCVYGGGMMGGGAIILIVFAVLAFVFALMIYLISLGVNLSEIDADFKMPFKSFKQFYFINPDKYELNFGWVKYKTGYYEKYYIKFNWFDIHRYNIFMLQQLIFNKNKEQRKKYLEYAQHVKKDISQYESNAESELNKMINDIEQDRQHYVDKAKEGIRFV